MKNAKIFYFSAEIKKLRTKMKKNIQQSRILVAKKEIRKNFFFDFLAKLKIMYKNEEKSSAIKNFDC